MAKANRIITVGISPCWDIICRGERLAWGRHQQVESEQVLAAGKALNISRALAWLKVRSTAAGLWGKDDCRLMVENVRALSPYVDIRFTKVPGQTRCNVTICDTDTGRQMHLRAKSSLASEESLKKLASDLRRMLTPETIVVFAGAMPEGPLLDECLAIIAKARDAGAKVAVDTSGAALKKIIRLNGIWLIKPNIDELTGLLGARVADNDAAVAKAARNLCDNVGMILVSRGAKGATLVTADKALHGRAPELPSKVTNTVGCGDYLLAGLLAGLHKDAGIRSAITTAIKLATAKACGLTETLTWPQARRKIKTSVRLS